MEKFQLLAVVSLPQCAFAHFGAGVKASIIFVRKRKADEKPDENEAIFMAAPALIGYDATGRKTNSQLDEIIQKYEEFQKDATSFFAWTPDAKDLCVFAVKRGDMKNRLDINYNLPQYTMLEEKLYQTFGENLKRISDIADVICGPFGSAIKNTDYQDSGIPLVRITNINKDGYMNYDDLIYISEKLGDSLSKTQVSNGDIVVSQRGSLGQCAIVDDSFPKMNISANIIAIKNINGVSVSFLHDYFLSTVGQTLLERSVSGQVQSKITTQDIADLLIPVNTDETKLTDLLDSAYKSYKRKLQQADKLQRKNPTYLIERLGLTSDYSETQKLTYATTAGSIEGRIDADYYSPKFSHFRSQIEALPYHTVSVDDISEKIVSGFAAGKPGSGRQFAGGSASSSSSPIQHNT